MKTPLKLIYGHSHGKIFLMVLDKDDLPLDRISVTLDQWEEIVDGIEEMKGEESRIIEDHEQLV